MFVRIKSLDQLRENSSYDTQMENYVLTKEHRIIEVDPINIDGRTYYKCPELDYFYFSEFMFDISFEVGSLLSIKKTIQELLNNSKNIDYQDSYYEDGTKDGYEEALEEVLELFKNI